MPNEEHALVLDYLSKGKSSSYKTEPLAQVMGTTHFTLLEVVPKTSLSILEEVYIGKETRDKIDFIKKRIPFEELTSTAQSEIERAIKKIVVENPGQFLEFYNSCGPISIKRHRLELLPGIGKKHVVNILQERQKKPFESYDDIEKRVHLMPDPIQAIVKRILQEMQEPDLKYYLFTRPPVKPGFQKQFRPRRRY